MNIHNYVEVSITINLAVSPPKVLPTYFTGEFYLARAKYRIVPNKPR